MKKTALISCACAALLFAMPASTSAQEGGDYLTKVTSSADTTFVDCIHFSTTTGPGSLFTMDGLPGEMHVWAHTKLDTTLNRWHTSPVMGNSILLIAFHGTISADGERISGEAISESGTTFVFRGRLDEACAVTSPREEGKNLYWR